MFFKFAVTVYRLISETALSKTGYCIKSSFFGCQKIITIYLLAVARTWETMGWPVATLHQGAPRRGCHGSKCLWPENVLVV